MTPGPWLDCGSIGTGGFEEHVYINRQSLTEAAREFLGWHPPSAVKERDDRIRELREECEQLALELADMRKRFDAIDLIESEGFRARKKPGRPAKEAVA